MQNHSKRIRHKADPVRLSLDLLQTISSSAEKYLTIDEMYPGFPFREFTKEHLPQLYNLALSLRVWLEREQHAVVIEELALVDMERHLADFVLMALCACIGNPSVTNPTDGKIIWEVITRSNLPINHKPTISETNTEADLHTDSAYRLMPERYFALLCLQPARDGGDTLLLDAATLLSHLRSSPDGAKCERILRTLQFPIRVPDSFIAARDVDNNVIVASLLADEPMIRFRHDLITEGIHLVTRSDKKRLLWALEILNRSVTQCPKTILTMKRGDIIFINNHTMLHGRTGFSSSDRLLLRVRIDRATDL